MTAPRAPAVPGQLSPRSGGCAVCPALVFSLWPHACELQFCCRGSCPLCPARSVTYLWSPARLLILRGILCHRCPPLVAHMAPALAQRAPVSSHDPSFFKDLFLSHITKCSGLTLWLSCCNCGISTGSFCWLCSWVSCPQAPSLATLTHARPRLLCFCPSVSALKTAACTWTPGSLPPPQGSSGPCLVSYVRNLVFVVLMYLLVQSSFTDKEVSKLLSPARKSHTI